MSIRGTVLPETNAFWPPPPFRRLPAAAARPTGLWGGVIVAGTQIQPGQGHPPCTTHLPPCTFRYADLGGPATLMPDAARMRVAMARFTSLHDIPGFDISEFLSGWFLGAPGDSIPRENIREVSDVAA